MLSPQTIQELRDRLKAITPERVALVTRADDLEAEAESIQDLLERYAQPEPKPVATAPSQPRRGESRSVWIRHALRDLDRVVIPSEVGQMMTEAGFKWNNGMDRVAIVSTDLHRMAQAKSGQVKRVKRGKYRSIDTGGAP